ncbi:MAG: HD domain-containing protein [Clostridia bacterium]|nr:HD domain-containing protein [Clostridia bacterium]
MAECELRRYDAAGLYWAASGRGGTFQDATGAAWYALSEGEDVAGAVRAATRTAGEGRKILVLPAGDVLDGLDGPLQRELCALCAREKIRLLSQIAADEYFDHVTGCYERLTVGKLGDKACVRWYPAKHSAYGALKGEAPAGEVLLTYGVSSRELPFGGEGVKLSDHSPQSHSVVKPGHSLIEGIEEALFGKQARSYRSRAIDIEEYERVDGRNRSKGAAVSLLAQRPELLIACRDWNISLFRFLEEGRYYNYTDGATYTYFHFEIPWYGLDDGEHFASRAIIDHSHREDEILPTRFLPLPEPDLLNRTRRRTAADRPERVSVVEAFVFSRFNDIDDAKWRTRAVYHSHAVSLLCALLGKKRGLDPETAAIAGLLHDLYAYERRDYADHAHKGAARAREVLKSLDLTTPDENEFIASAIYHHDDLTLIDGPMDELLKDADLIDNALSHPARAVKENEAARIRRIRAELGLL